MPHSSPIRKSSVPKRSPSSKSRVLVLISREEAAEFFGEPDLEALREDHNVTWIDQKTKYDLSESIRELEPRIIIGAWSTPRLPMIDGRPPAELYCHICGSVRRQITRAHLEAGMRVTNWGSSVARTVAESALMLALAASRNVGYHMDSIHYSKGWKNPKSPPQKSLVEAHIGIHGMGQIGRSLIQLLKPFEAKLSAFDPFVDSSVFDTEGVQRIDDLDELFRSNEVIFECCALTPETEGIVSRKRIQMLPEDATFINIGRGHLVDEDALAEAIAQGRIRAGLDVYRTEPLPENSPLRGQPGLVAIPHLGGNNQKARHIAGRVALENVRAFLNGAPLRNEISIEKFDLMT